MANFFKTLGVVAGIILLLELAAFLLNLVWAIPFGSLVATVALFWFLGWALWKATTSLLNNVEGKNN